MVLIYWGDERRKIACNKNVLTFFIAFFKCSHIYQIYQILFHVTLYMYMYVMNLKSLGNKMICFVEVRSSPAHEIFYKEVECNL